MQRSQPTTTTYSRDKINFLCVRQKNTRRKATSTRPTLRDMQRSHLTTTTYSRDKTNFLCVRRKIQHERPQVRDIHTFRDMQRSHPTACSREINFLAYDKNNTTRKTTRHGQIEALTCTPWGPSHSRNCPWWSSVALRWCPST